MEKLPTSHLENKEAEIDQERRKFESSVEEGAGMLDQIKAFGSDLLADLKGEFAPEAMAEKKKELLDQLGGIREGFNVPQMLIQAAGMEFIFRDASVEGALLALGVSAATSLGYAALFGRKPSQLAEETREADSN